MIAPKQSDADNPCFDNSTFEDANVPPPYATHHHSEPPPQHPEAAVRSAESSGGSQQQTFSVTVRQGNAPPQDVQVSVDTSSLEAMWHRYLQSAGLLTAMQSSVTVSKAYIGFGIVELALCWTAWWFPGIIVGLIVLPMGVVGFLHFRTTEAAAAPTMGIAPERVIHLWSRTAQVLPTICLIAAVVQVVAFANHVGDFAVTLLLLSTLPWISSVMLALISLTHKTSAIGGLDKLEKLERQLGQATARRTAPANPAVQVQY